MLAVLLALPLAFTGDRYIITLMTLTLVWVGVALSWNIVSGDTGYISFGHAAFYGLGAYAAGIVADRFGAGIFPAVVAAAIVTALLALVIGALTLRLQGHYFAIATLAMAETTRVVIAQWRDLTGGTFGLGLPVDFQSASPVTQFYTVLGAVAVATAISLAVQWSRYGSRLTAIRQDELALESLGIDPRPYKISAFVLSGSLTGVFGALSAWILGFLTPEAFLDPAINLQIIVMVIIGGMGTVLGPLVGAAFFYLLSDTVLVEVPQAHLVVLGIILIALMLFLRRGLVGTVEASRIWPKGFKL